MTPNRPKIFSCPGCSLRVSGTESACPGCGKLFGPDVRLECPFCGTLVLPDSESCPSCQVDYSEFAEKAEEHLWEKALDKIVEEIEFLRTEAEAEKETGGAEKEPAPEPSVIDETLEAICPVCKRALNLTDNMCPGCGTVFEPSAPEESGGSEEACCPICGEMVGLEVLTCPFCGAEFESEEELIPEPPEPEPGKVFKKPKVVQRPKAVHVEREFLTPTPEVKTRASGGLSNGVSVTNGIGRINGKSLVNGRSHINGVHLVNGIGAVNGRDLVNGTGMLNGTDTRKLRFSGGRARAPFYLRWQFIAILVAIAIMVPSILHVVNLGDEAPYSIDGDFRDWDDKTMFGVQALSEVTSTQVMEWSVDSHREAVYLYVRTAEDLMIYPVAERLVLFIDHDDSIETGYTIGEIGADYIIEVSGWNGSIRSSILMEFRSDEDHLDWSQWSSARYARSSVVSNQLEAMAELPQPLTESAKFILAAQNEQGVTGISYSVATDGGLLIVEQKPVPSLSEDEILARSASTDLIRLRFTCQGSGGTVESVSPTLIGLTAYEPIGQFSMDVGDEHVVDLLVDSSGLVDGQFVSATIAETDISSTFRYVQVVGDPIRAYISAPPTNISIDGAFADWENRTVGDLDGTSISDPNIDIDEVGVNRTEADSFFFIGVQGQLCAGAYVPKSCAVQTSAGGGTVIPARCTAEDFIRIYIDSDGSSASGKLMTVASLTIGADHMIEVCGFYCRIVSTHAYHYIAGSWVLVSVPVDAAKDSSRIEIGIMSEAIGSPDSIEFLVEATDWRGEADYASNQTELLWARTWAVDSSGTSQYATALSYQRKLFHDGSNFWSFYFDGTNTVCEYSTDGGETWTSRGSVFKTSGVREVSIWYDSDNSVVYATGDTASSTSYIYVQKGSVNAGSSTITWAASDSTPTVSTLAVSGKNSYISRDVNGYLWILCTDLTKSSPQYKYQLESWQSNSANDITAWISRGDLLPSAQTQDGDVCGSIVPAGSGSDVWAIYAYEGEGYSNKYTSGSWGSEQTIYSVTGTQEENTVTSPPSVVVDNSLVVHVVYGDASEDGGLSKPKIWYTRNNTGAQTWVSSIDLDSTKPSDVGNKYPTISVDTATGDLYAFWMRTDTSSVPQTVMGKIKENGGGWTSISLGSQNSYTKQHLTSIYSVSGESNICWLWTQNTSGTIEVFFDIIPEFDTPMIPILSMIAVFIVLFSRKRIGDNARDSSSDLTS